ncbi:molecular chaperone DnaJ [Candidatus Pacearchaeota archaeon]|nr:molecular chaperone DnaJ [Candidatus Pacearchaeota archaeon]
MAKKDYYEILGVSKSDTKDAIKKAYKKLALKYHPDKAPKNKKTEYEEKFKEMSEAYTVLTDDKKRSQYDSMGQDAFNQGYSQENFSREEDISNIFKDLFGNSFFGGSQGDSFRTTGDDLQYELIIDFKEAAFGCEKKIEIRKDILCDSCDGTGAKDKKLDTCDKCNGEGRITINRRTPFGIFRQVAICDKCNGEGKIPKQKCKHCDGRGVINKKQKLTVNIPQGIDNNQFLKIRGEGNAIKGGENGNLLLVIRVKPHKVFKRDGDDIYINFPISFSQAALGCKISIPTLSGDTKIKIASGTESNTVFRLKGEGVKNVNNYRTGDQFVNIKVETPKSLNRKQKKLFEELAKLEK